VAKRATPEPLNAEQRIARAFADLEEATRLAFDAKTYDVDALGDEIVRDKPDLQSLARLIELAFKANGVLSADGKKINNGDAPVAVPLDELERLVKAAAKKLKGNDGKDG